MALTSQEAADLKVHTASLATEVARLKNATEDENSQFGLRVTALNTLTATLTTLDSDIDALVS